MCRRSANGDSCWRQNESSMANQISPGELRFIDPGNLQQLFVFPPDMKQTEHHYNTLNNQVLVNTFEKEWAIYSR